MCQNILNEEEDDIPVSDGEKASSNDASNEANGNIVDKLSALDINNKNIDVSVNGKIAEDENMNNDVSDNTPSANTKKINKGNDNQISADGNENTEIVANERD